MMFLPSAPSRGTIALLVLLSFLVAIPTTLADQTLTTATTWNYLQIATGTTLVTNGFPVTVNGSSTGGTLIYGFLDARGTAGSATLFTQRHNYFRTSGAGDVLFSGTGRLLLTGTGASFALTASGTLQNLTIDKGLIGYWRFDDGLGSSGTTIRDSSRTRLTSTLYSNPTWTGSTFQSTPTNNFYNPHALDFDGTDDRVVIADHAALDVKKISVCAWTWADVNAGANVISRQAGSTIAAGEWKMGIGVAGSYMFRTRVGASTVTATSATSFSVGAWHHLCGVYDGARVRLFVDGVQTASNILTGDLVANATVPLISAQQKSAPEAFWNGRLDEIRIYGYGLSASEVSTLYNQNKHTGSGVYLMGSNLAVSGSLAIFGSELDTSASNYTVTVTGSWLNEGRFNQRSGTVYLGANSQTITGSTVFNNLTKTPKIAKTLTLDNISRQSVSGALTLNGLASNLLSLRSNISGSSAALMLDGDAGTQSIQYLDVQDSNAAGGSTLTCTTGCTNSGNNTGWSFAAAAARKLKHWFFFFGL